MASERKEGWMYELESEICEALGLSVSEVTLVRLELGAASLPFVEIHRVLGPDDAGRIQTVIQKYAGRLLGHEDI